MAESLSWLYNVCLQGMHSRDRYRASHALVCGGLSLGSRALERTYLLTGPVPDGQSLIDIRIGKPRLDRMEHEHLHLRKASTPSRI